MIVTAEQLRKLGACEGAVARLVALFGDSVDVTEEWCVAHALVAECVWDWAAGKLLPTHAWENYDRALAPASNDYFRAVAIAFAKVTDWNEHEQTRATALAGFHRAVAAAWAVYAPIAAPLFGRLLNENGNAIKA